MADQFERQVLFRRVKLIINYLNSIKLYIGVVLLLFSSGLVADSVETCEPETVIKSWESVFDGKDEDLITISSNENFISYRSDLKRYRDLNETDFIPGVIKLNGVEKTIQKIIEPPSSKVIENCLLESVRNNVLSLGIRDIFSLSPVKKKPGLTYVAFFPRDDSISPGDIAAAKKKVKDNYSRFKSDFAGCVVSQSGSLFKSSLDQGTSVSLNDKDLEFKIPVLTEQKTAVKTLELTCEEMSENNAWVKTGQCPQYFKTYQQSDVFPKYFISSKNIQNHYFNSVKKEKNNVSRLRLCGKLKNNKELFFEVCNYYTTFGKKMGTPYQCRAK